MVARMHKKHDVECRSLLGYLSDYVDGDLNPALCREIEQHAAGCNNCRVVVDTLRKTVSLYHELAAETPEIPVEARSRLFKTLNLDDYLH